MRAAVLLVLAGLSFGACQKDDFLAEPELSSSIDSKLDLSEYRGFIAPVGNASHDRPQLEAHTDGALVRRDCAAGQKACSSGSCAPSDATCCSGSKYCPDGGKCCLNSCALSGGSCCSDGHACDAGQVCCESKCIPAGTKCCKADGGSYCFPGNQCVIWEGDGVCCTDLSCTAYVGENGATTSRRQTYTFRYTFYWYSYYYTILDLTSTRKSTWTTWYITGSDSARATSSVLALTSSFKNSLTAAANTTPKTTPTARSTATARTARVTADAEPTDGGFDLSDGATASPTAQQPTASGPSPSGLSGDVPPAGEPGAASQPKELNMLCLAFGIVISLVMMRL